MKPISTPGSSPSPFTRLLTLILFAASSFPVHAQWAVTNVFSHRVNSTVQTVYTGTGATGNAPSGLTGTTYTYQFGFSVAGTRLLLDSFTALGMNFHYQSATLVTKFRRVDNASV